MGELLLYSGREEEDAPHTEGVGLMLSREVAGSLMEWTAVLSRIINLSFYTKVRKVLIVQCYVPTNDAEDDHKADVYDLLQSVMDQKAKRD